MSMDPTTLRTISAACAGLAVVLLVAAVSLTLTARRRRRAALPADLPAVRPAESRGPESAPAHAEPHEAEVREPGSVEVRTLRAQVRSLEQTLEQLRGDQVVAPAMQSAAQVEAPVAVGELCAGEREDARREAYAEALLAVRALAATTDPAEHPQHTLARVTAALQRLHPVAGTDEVWARPVLAAGAAPVRPQQRPVSQPVGQVAPPVAPSVAPPVAPSVAPPVAQPVVPAVAEPVVPPEPEPAAESLTEPLTEPLTQPVAEPAAAAAVPPSRVRPEPEVVLPVPPPAHHEQRPTRRRLRRHAVA